MNKKEFREKLINMFREALGQEGEEWYSPWFHFASQKNGTTNIKYKGINACTLGFVQKQNNWTDSRWFTFNQIRKLNETRDNDKKLSVEGQHGTAIEFFTVWDTQDRKNLTLSKYYELWRFVNHNDTNAVDEFNRRYHIITKYTTVFNAHQIRNMEIVEPQPNEEIEQQAEFIEGIAGKLNVKLTHEEIDASYYVKELDEIHLPLPSYFRNVYDYIAVAIHEMAHSTGHPDRLNRTLNGDKHSKEYALEELIAEMTSAFLGFTIGNNAPESVLTNHTAYIQSWSRILDDDPDAFLKAVSQAQKAADYIETNALN